MTEGCAYYVIVDDTVRQPGISRNHDVIAIGVRHRVPGKVDHLRYVSVCNRLPVCRARAARRRRQVADRDLGAAGVDRDRLIFCNLDAPAVAAGDLGSATMQIHSRRLIVVDGDQEFDIFILRSPYERQITAWQLDAKRERSIVVTRQRA